MTITIPVLVLWILVAAGAAVILAFAVFGVVMLWSLTSGTGWWSW